MLERAPFAPSTVRDGSAEPGGGQPPRLTPREPTPPMKIIFCSQHIQTEELIEGLRHDDSARGSAEGGKLLGNFAEGPG